MDCITEAKIDFKQKLSKGLILGINELKLAASDEDFHQYNRIIQNWYYQIQDLNFLPKLGVNTQEVAIHSPTHIIYTQNGEQEELDTDLTTDDLQTAFEILATKYKQDWNYTTPFCSFKGELQNKEVRFTLIHHSASSEKISKLFIRIHKKDIIELNTFKHAEFLEKAIIDKKNILIAGSTGSGKTTLINSLLSKTKASEHLAIIEDTEELISPNLNTTRFLADDHCINKSMKDYLSYAMRISPERIILGELRSSEVEAAILAMNTGHNGFLSTIHANSAVDSIHRMAMLFKLYAKHDLNYELILKLITKNIDYIVFMKDKQVTEIIEVFGAEAESIIFDSIM